uniref:Uncharacterized protein n=1 Tax=Romanomermis culicivorax TaxID=13658 RepID=A0A915K6I5_ROMCU
MDRFDYGIFILLLAVGLKLGTQKSVYSRPVVGSIGGNYDERAQYLTYDTLGTKWRELNGGKRAILEGNQEKNVALFAVRKEETRSRERVAWAAMSL